MEDKVKFEDVFNDIDLSDITLEQYQKADEIVRRFKYQQDKTLQASLVYKGTISVTIKVPDNMSEQELVEELKDGYYGFDIYDGYNVELDKLEEFILDGEYVNIKRPKKKV